MDTAVSSHPPSAAPPLFKKRTTKTTARKRPATPPPASDSDESGYTSTEGESGQRIKRRKKSAIVTATSTNPSKSSQNANDTIGTTNFAADRSTTIAPTDDATKQSNWYDEKALLGTTRPKAAVSTSTATASNNNNNNSKPAAGGGGGAGKQVGPVKAPTNVRTITVTDFAPDVCKDYKQTGFCGFGDSCKFLHAREDYKQGWELDKDWEKVGAKNKPVPGQRRRKVGDEEADEKEEEEDALLATIPFACIICKEGYKQPIVTKCGHYFCEGCALGRYRKNPNCAACGAGTNGVFNGAKQLKKLLDRKRERARKRREKAKEEGEEVSEEEEGEGEGEGEA